MSTESQPGGGTPGSARIAHVLFLDIVGYSRSPPPRRGGCWNS